MDKGKYITVEEAAKKWGKTATGSLLSTKSDRTEDGFVGRRGKVF